ncbi:ABC-type nitrate/sulfonate/bicarbonate transport system, ATPase component [Desulfitobacterium dichloroeliminans LMG P-21439]|uniref:ABC-type nitrate/sulfonate/bicarbonate transport system, ATPase component n=1 Tax=Desulfitobacterium dichloroeliminans (strain LMG P-21439 / DCA1) TaxID=871963 RepID=L0F6G5_DESDL|nr:ABC transporter ATP-binding protein [Desulfitobacterium dichloroeliminans]AGA68610.1 ABC-type nitrate/sulfonate/bicarbonate transport system, ATPase component [Desulfitobacterium dichloroeliminans LMG P-21439]
MAIQIKGLGKHFPQDGKQTDVLVDINLTVNDGDFVSLLGPSGCGKSTLLNIIAGLEKSSKGEVLVDHQLVTGPKSDRVMVFQEAALFPWLSVMDNVMFGLKMKGVPARQAQELAQETLKMVHLSRFTKAYPHELSGGMRQRVAIARALVMDPKYLLMDEPFGALDEQTKLLLHSELQDIWQKTKKTIIFVTHSIHEAVQLSNRVMLMGTRPGRIIKEFLIPYSQPRSKSDPNLTYIEGQIFDDLKEEIEKVMQEEVDHDYHVTSNRLPWSADRDLGSNI